MDCQSLSLGEVARAGDDGEGVDADKKKNFMVKWIKMHWEVLSYLIFGVLTTLLNILLYALFNRLFGYTAANSWGNVLDNILCILFAYATNRAFVFNSKTRGRAMAKEFGAFVTCRLGTMVLDAAIMMMRRQPDGRAGCSADGRADAGAAERACSPT